jgi:dTDP-4-dehydrorhamnose 3,5-epimerase
VPIIEATLSRAKLKTPPARSFNSDYQPSRSQSGEKWTLTLQFLYDAASGGLREKFNMKITRLDIQGLLLIDLSARRDERGFFLERFNAQRFRDNGLPADFVQDNHSRSAPAVLRGLHYQYDPPQGKLIGVISGRIWDVVVDIRADSPTYGRTASFELEDVKPKLLWVPAGFAHGFCVLGEEPADVLYKVDACYNVSGESGIVWADSQLAIEWPVPHPLVSPRDRRLPTFADYRANPVKWPGSRR